MRYLAIDYGARRTGLAICDPHETIASPLRVLEGPDRLCERIAEVVAAESAQAVVVGLPLNMDDTEGPQARAVRRFVESLQGHLKVPIHLCDERLSTFSAQEKLAGMDLPAGKRRKRLDAVAAAEILQTFLDQRRS
ncbi:MAG: Holliday junction resolvase RuvX [Phycisphaerae bacterium]|nr:Holliday junction resolvase RuvX [Phycisphaerae bacterium]